MRRDFLLTILAALPGAVLGQHSTSACPKKGVHIIAGPGAGGTGTEDYGYLSSTVLAIQKAIPGSNNFCLGPYQGQSVDTTLAAEQQAKAHLHSFHKSCPKTPIVFVGYSAGAIGLMNTLCGNSPVPPWPKAPPLNRKKYNIVAFVSYGDETRSAGKSYNRGTCRKNSPKGPRTTSKGCKGFFKHMRAYCDKADGDCCTGGVEGGPAHFAYPQKYDGRVAKFMASQFRHYKKHHGKSKHHHKHHHKKHNHKKHNAGLAVVIPKE